MKKDIQKICDDCCDGVDINGQYVGKVFQWLIDNGYAVTKNDILKDNGNPLELRMYFFVPYNLSPIQQGIQAGHALGRHCLKYGRYNPNHIVWDFLEKWETWIILNGGTTNDQRDFEMIPAGSLNQIGDQLLTNDIEFAHMIEPDLNRALTALSFICDERVFNYEDYPNFVDFIINKLYNGTASPESVVRLKMIPYERLIESYEKEYNEWVEFIGGKKNIFLRELLKGKKLA